MKCLSLMQPWATLVIIGAKQHETRGWKTPFRGPLLIHSSKRFPPYCRQLCEREPFLSALRAAGHTDPRTLPLGHVLGGVLVEGCEKTDVLLHEGVISATERAFGDYNPGRWAWRLANPHPLVVPIRLPGQLGLFDVPETLLDGNFLLHWKEVANVH